MRVRTSGRSPLEREIERGKCKVDFLDTCRERWHQDDGVEDRPGEKTVGARCKADRFTESLTGRKFPAVRTPEFDAGDEPALPDFMDDRVTGFQ